MTYQDTRDSLPTDEAIARGVMIKTVEIRNFRGFEHFRVEGLRRVNLIVGDNAVGKTAFLESLYLTLSADAGKGFILKQWRGADIAFQKGSGDSVAEAIYADLFHDPQTSEPIKIDLIGEGFENRQLEITKTKGDVLVPVGDEPKAGNRHERRAQKARQKLLTSQTTTVPILMTWTADGGKSYGSRVSLSPQGLRFENTGEQIPNSHMFAAQVPVSIEEAALQYSALRKNREAEKFRTVFMSTFDWIRDLSVESVGGQTTILADVPWAKQLLPLPTLSGGTTRAASILLAMTTRRGGVTLVDEVEGGIYHARHEHFVRALLEMSRAFNSQLIMTSHSAEWLEKFLSVVSDEDEDIAMWRMERMNRGAPQIRRFTVAEFRSGFEMGEMR